MIDDVPLVPAAEAAKPGWEKTFIETLAMEALREGAVSTLWKGHTPSLR